ncbi:DEAD/DEAH box helicase [Dactylosporangium sp. NPDC048998]|uniref:DEAD/DEAH box helicase n=1 Tax=Dactylosporangium sp. NPDC048998 TaxID=3363976 RepID=UPI003712FA6B
MRLLLSEAEAALRAVFGAARFLRARQSAERGEVVEVRWLPEQGRYEGRLASPRSASVTATFSIDNGECIRFEGSCTCADRSDCVHPEALALLASAEGARPGETDRPAVAKQPRGRDRVVKAPAWEGAVSKLVSAVAPPQGNEEDDGQPPTLGLQFEPLQQPATGRAAPSWRIVLRPVIPGRKGWVRTGVSWSSLGYTRFGSSNRAERHKRLLQQIVTLSSIDGGSSYYGYVPQTIFLDGFVGRRIWDLLSEAQDVGLPMMQSSGGQGPVTVTRSPGRVSLAADRADDAMVLSAALVVDGATIDDEGRMFVGRPPHGVAWWDSRGPGERLLRLAPLAEPLTPAMAKALDAPAIRIPPADEDRFFRDVYPELTGRISVVAASAAVRLPTEGPVRLLVAVERLSGPRMSLGWHWVRTVGGEDRLEPLNGPAASDVQRRQTLIDRVTGIVAGDAPSLLAPAATGMQLAAATVVSGDEVIHLSADVLPRLAELDGVEVRTTGPEFREFEESPAIAFVDTDGADGSDWFDLAIRVAVGGENVAFNELFVALAEDRRFLALPSGAYFRLDRPEFQRLRELIEESRALEDVPPGMIRVGRFQLGVWQDLADLGEVDGRARAWQESIRALTNVEPVGRPEPAGLDADLRPYQRDGFAWLTALYDCGLGGILADDMGLGKTVQALALMCSVREQPGAGGPFLVVAPASVVSNWAAEAHRFVPDLTARVVTQARTRRGIDMADVANGADLVITSYTLFRLEYDAYEAVKWSGLVLDEAQFIKNSQSQAHRCARRLPAPFKLAITGTPMENNLAELWSLCAVTAPGLFPRLDRFTEYYRNPIERHQDSGRLAQLRRRIRPLVLRRGKGEVAGDLPEKQEQVIELELNAKHRRLYQTYLQRERQKVLGLLGDLEKNRFEIFRSLTLLRQASLDVTLVDPRHHGVSSTKLDMLEEQITGLVAEGHRALVFSQFTTFLTAARNRLEQIGVRCCYLDGSTRNRATVIDEFKTGTDPVFLISLKAGGFGLNLTEADYCILLDPWWNPATEAQAVDRAHRIGQTRPVMVYRLVAKDTIEEKVMALKARKAELFSSVLDGGDFASARLTAADIRALLE